MDDVTVICLHGFLGAPSGWDEVAGALREAGLRVEVPWLPGHGPAPRFVDLASFDEVVDAMAGALLGRPVVLLGYSLVARLALALAAKAPGDVRGVLAIGAHTGLASEIERAKRVAWEERLARDLREDGLEAFVAAWEALPIFATQATLPRTVLERQRATPAAHDAHGVAWAMEVLGTGRMPLLVPRLRQAAVPVVLAAGALDDRAVGVAREAMGALSRCEAAIVSGAGHNLLLEATATVTTLALDVARRAALRGASQEASR